MSKTNIDFAASLSSKVIPVDKPQVANAETVSKSRFRKLIFGSNMESANTEMAIINADIMVME